MRRLVVRAGRANIPELQLEGGDVLVGRARDADLRLQDETVSRRHARILEEDGRTVLEDLGSANGILLNGEAVRDRAVLFDGDEIRIGAVLLRYEVGGPDGATEKATVVRPGQATESVEAALDPDVADPAREAGDTATARRLRLVCDGAFACADAGEPGEVPHVLLSLVVDALGPDRATVLLLAPGGPEVRAAWPGGAGAPTSVTLRRRVLEEGEAVLVRDALDSEVRQSARSLVTSRYRSTLAAPLRTSEGVLGAVIAEAEAPDRWDATDLEALAAAARQAALALRNLRTLSFARAEIGRLHGGAAGTSASPLLGTSSAMDDVRARIQKAASVDTPVLVTGETGTGKELVARQLHAGGSRRRHPFVALNCAALVEGLLESELFGHEKGAFTGATASRDGRIAEAAAGTLFLDEVGDLPAPLQAKLLRVLSEGTYTRVGGQKTLRMACRLVTATNHDLKDLVEKGRFRQDLYYRLAVLEIHLPPLGERGDDVLEIAEAALEQIAARLGRRVPRLAADARDALGRHSWPGNVRELVNALERALVLHAGDSLKLGDLPAEVRGAGARAAAEGGTGRGDGEVLTLREAERRTVLAAIRAAHGKKSRMVEFLGTSWPTLNRKIREYGLEDEVERAKGTTADHAPD